MSLSAAWDLDISESKRVENRKSKPADARILPSGLNFMDEIAIVCPLRMYFVR
jgi:hypothetical protein